MEMRQEFPDISVNSYNDLLHTELISQSQLESPVQTSIDRFVFYKTKSLSLIDLLQMRKLLHDKTSQLLEKYT